MDRRHFMTSAALGGAGAMILAGGAAGALAAAPAPLPAGDLHNAAGGDLLAPVNPELRPAAEMMLRAIPAATGKPSVRSLAAGRAMMPARPRLVAPAVVARSVPGRNGAPAVPVFVINAEPGARRPVVVHLHGGGFVLGTAEGAVAMMQEQARALDCMVVTVDYRLAPEAPFPAPLEDAYAALEWTYDHCAELGGDPARIAVQGESAGGGLAAMLAIAARDRGKVPLVHQSLIYPMLDDRTGGEHQVPAHVGKLAWTAPLNQVAWAAFLGRPEGSRRVPPRGAAPARLSDLRGLAPAFVGVGSIDLFMGEDIDYARRLIEAGVGTELVVVPGAFHGFDVIAPATSVVRQFRRAHLSALARAFGKPALETLPA